MTALNGAGPATAETVSEAQNDRLPAGTMFQLMPCIGTAVIICRHSSAPSWLALTTIWF